MADYFVRDREREKKITNSSSASPHLELQIRNSSSLITELYVPY